MNIEENIAKQYIEQQLKRQFLFTQGGKVVKIKDIIKDFLEYYGPQKEEEIIDRWITGQTEEYIATKVNLPVYLVNRIITGAKNEILFY